MSFRSLKLHNKMGVERKNCSLQEMARTMLNAHKLAINFAPKLSTRLVTEQMVC